ncbi:MAG: GDSL-type esterase/lipase family protein, partial [Polyangiaceae bacterium]
PGVADGGGGAGGAQAGAQNGGAGGASGGGAGSGSAGGGPIGGPSNGTDKITIWLSGDSTMANGTSPCPVGWGKQFQARFNANAKVVNSAVGGTTIRSWLYDVTSALGSDGECTLSSPTPQAHWTDMANGMKKGDYLLIQFGINDSTGPSCPKHVSVDTFKKLLGIMAQAAKDAGAQPVFLTAVSSISCSGSMAKGTRAGFATATKDAATQYGVPVIDLEQLSVALYTSLDFCPSTDSASTFSANTPIGNFFCDDHTHFEAAGSIQIANLVAKALRDQGFGLASYLVP